MEESRRLSFGLNTSIVPTTVPALNYNSVNTPSQLPKDAANYCSYTTSIANNMVVLSVSRESTDTSNKQGSRPETRNQNY